MKTAQKVISVALSLTIILSMVIGFNLLSAQGSSNGLYVSGTKLYDGDGGELILRGVNVAHAWYTWATDSSISAIASLGANSVRVVCADGARWSKTSYSELNTIINKCRSLGLICVLEVHDTTGSDSTSDLTTAVNYWIEMKDLLNSNKDYVIVNIGNEWMGTWNKGSTWASANKSAIQSLRNAGIQNVLMVDAPGYGQETQPCIDYCKEIVSADTTGNTVMSMHFYSVAGANSSVIKSNVNGVINKGCCLVIGEFGDYQNGGDVDELTVMSYCQEKGVGYMAWSWYGNSGGDENLDLTSNYASTSSLTTYGKTVFYDTNGIKNTSKLAYSGSTSTETPPTTSTTTTKATTTATTAAASPSPASGDTTRYEFENATLTGNAVAESPSENVSTASNSKIVKFQSGASGAYNTIKVTQSGTYTFTFAAVGLGSYDRYIQFYVGDNYYTETAPCSGWKTFSYNVTLSAGTYKFGAQTNGSWGWQWEWSYVDYVDVTAPESSATTTTKPTTTTKATTTTTKATTTTKPTTTTTTKATTTQAAATGSTVRYEFENATLTGNAVAESPSENVSTASNNKIVKFQSGASEAYNTITVSQSGTYTFTFAAVGLGSYDRYIQFYVGDNYYTETVPKSGWKTFTYNVTLSAGTYTFGAKTDGSWGWQWEWSYVDYVDVTSPSGAAVTTTTTKATTTTTKATTTTTKKTTTTTKKTTTTTKATTTTKKTTTTTRSWWSRWWW